MIVGGIDIERLSKRQRFVLCPDAQWCNQRLKGYAFKDRTRNMYR